MQRAPLSSGRLSGLTVAVKDLFDIAGSLTTYGNPDWASTHGVARATAPLGCQFAHDVALPRIQETLAAPGPLPGRLSTDR